MLSSGLFTDSLCFIQERRPVACFLTSCKILNRSSHDGKISSCSANITVGRARTRQEPRGVAHVTIAIMPETQGVGKKCVECGTAPARAPVRCLAVQNAMEVRSDSGPEASVSAVCIKLLQTTIALARI